MGNVKRVVSPGGFATQYDYDTTVSPVGKLVKVMSFNTSEISEVTQATDTSKYRTMAQLQYNALGLLSVISTPKPGLTNGTLVDTLIGYDTAGLGNITSIDAPGSTSTTRKVTSYEYETDENAPGGTYTQTPLLGLPIKVTEKVNTTPIRVTHIRYKEATNGKKTPNVDTVFDDYERKSTFEYNAADQIKKIVPSAP